MLLLCKSKNMQRSNSKNIVDTCQQTLLDHNKKCCLDALFVEILMTETKSLCRFFNYSNVVTYLEKMEEYLTLEESASGDFITYINNTGETC